MRRALPWVAMSLLVAGCVNQDQTLYEVRVSGDVSVVSGDESGAVHVGLYFAEAGEGELAFTVDLIDTRVVEAVGPVDETFLVPLDEREGLLVYAWLDRDGDGVLCAPGVDDEPAGLVAIQGDSFLDHAVSFSLTLDQPCAGPEALYP